MTLVSQIAPPDTSSGPAVAPSAPRTSSATSRPADQALARLRIPARVSLTVLSVWWPRLATLMVFRHTHQCGLGTGLRKRRHPGPTAVRFVPLEAHRDDGRSPIGHEA